MRNCILCLGVIFALISAGCRSNHTIVESDRLSGTRLGTSVEIVAQQTITDIGAGQGIYRDSQTALIYLYGDAQTGIVREYRVEGITDLSPRLRPTGRVLILTRHGEDIVPHPTGLTRSGGFTFLGDTVNQRGVIWAIDWDRAWRDGNLDNAILNQVVDDTAFNGTRPEFVRSAGQWVIATGDYGDARNELRTLDPERLMVASRTSARDTLLSRSPSGPFVQTIHSIEDRDLIVLVQNQTPGLGYRLTFGRIPAHGTWEVIDVIDLPSPTDELEGFAYLGNGWGVMLSAMRENNVTFVRMTLPE